MLKALIVLSVMVTLPAASAQAVDPSECESEAGFYFEKCNTEYNTVAFFLPGYWEEAEILSESMRGSIHPRCTPNLSKFVESVQSGFLRGRCENATHEEIRKIIVEANTSGRLCENGVLTKRKIRKLVVSELKKDKRCQ